MSRGEEVAGLEVRAAEYTRSKAKHSKERSDGPGKVVSGVLSAEHESGVCASVPLDRGHVDPPQKHKRKLKRHGPNLSLDDLASVFSSIAADKITIGRAEFEQTVERLDLDIGSDAVDAAFELLAESEHAGPCNRVNKKQFLDFMSVIGLL